MRNLWKSVLGLWVIGMGLGVSAPAQAASGIGPYYAMPSWDQTLPAATRFLVLAVVTVRGGGAVLDRETGLVWEQSPSTDSFVWFDASSHCAQLSKGGRKGWRLPTIQDLASLIDPNQENPALPLDHPFSNVQPSVYWSATTKASDSTFAWAVTFLNGFLFFVDKSHDTYVWCVRGGHGNEAQ